MQKILVKDIMQKNVITLKQAESLSAAYDYMIQKDIRHLPVVDHKGKLIGIISDRDVLVDASTDNDDRVRPIDNLVKDVMNEKVFTCRAEDNVRDAVTLMIEHRINGVPVVNDQEHVIGMVTTTDILRLFWSHSFNDHEREQLLSRFQDEQRARPMI